MTARRADVKSKTGRKGRESPNLPVITLLTDFGNADYFVGAVKGAILSVNPRAVIADITHEIPPQDVEAAAFTLLASYQAFPVGTIHVAVVDPGVGSERRPIVVNASDQLFVGPDNGIFTYIYDREPSHQVFHITSDKYFRPSPSTTFHGRDIFAPVAAALSKGVKPEDLGSVITDTVRLKNSLTPEVLKIIHIDRFGNCITNITRDLIDPKRHPTLVINRKQIRAFREFYSSASPNEVFAIWGSAGFLEISMNGRSAAKILRAKRGDTVLITQDSQS
ncbi:MAG TPA: SAM-dependent chlorinase/fluorinase [Pyrinomonadaceae bacterium]|nr:SAM-dependent chlorinase/fluorinase [Pyrinomonadaceae bacterium]